MDYRQYMGGELRGMAIWQFSAMVWNGSLVSLCQYRVSVVVVVARGMNSHVRLPQFL